MGNFQHFKCFYQQKASLHNRNQILFLCSIVLKLKCCEITEKLFIKFYQKNKLLASATTNIFIPKYSAWQKYAVVNRRHVLCHTLHTLCETVHTPPSWQSQGTTLVIQTGLLCPAANFNTRENLHDISTTNYCASDYGVFYRSAVFIYLVDAQHPPAVMEADSYIPQSVSRYVSLNIFMKERLFSSPTELVPRISAVK